MATIDIDVNADHIEQGTPESRKRCPVALAMKEQLGVRRTRVDETSATIGWTKDRITQVTLPEKAEMFIKRFDMGEDVRPFHFQLEVDFS